MQTVAGVFTSREAAERAVARLDGLVPLERIGVLFPGTPKSVVESIPTTQDMPPAGRQMAAALGGALGLGLGATIFLPAVGAITALGVVGAVLMSVAGAVTGATVGKAADDAGTTGIPIDELYVYEDALRKGRSVVIVHTDGDVQTAAVRKRLDESGAESVNAARENWWIGLRDAEAAEYEATGGDFARDERVFRMGFQAALDAHARGRTHAEDLGRLQKIHPAECTLPAFVKGYERGRGKLVEWSSPPETQRS